MTTNRTKETKGTIEKIFVEGPLEKIRADGTTTLVRVTELPRPKAKPRTVRTRLVGPLQLKLTDIELAEVEKAAGKLGPQAWAKNVVLKAARARTKGRR